MTTFLALYLMLITLAMTQKEYDDSGKTLQDWLLILGVVIGLYGGLAGAMTLIIELVKYMTGA